jgi:predicted transcriptional regulator
MNGLACPNEVLITLTSDIVAAHVSNNTVEVSKITQPIGRVFEALAALGQLPAVEEELIPVVTVRSSIKLGHLACLEDGKRFKTLKRHLMTEHGMTRADYRERWALSADYPMVAREYAEKRSAISKQLGLGRRPAKKAGRGNRSSH